MRWRQAAPEVTATGWCWLFGGRFIFESCWFRQPVRSRIVKSFPSMTREVSSGHDSLTTSGICQG